MNLLQVFPSFPARESSGSHWKGGAMRREINMTSLSGSQTNPVSCPERISIDNPQDVMQEVKKIILLIFRKFEFNQFEQVFCDVLRLFNGNYPAIADVTPCTMT